VWGHVRGRDHHSACADLWRRFGESGRQNPGGKSVSVGDALRRRFSSRARSSERQACNRAPTRPARNHAKRSPFSVAIVRAACYASCRRREGVIQNLFLISTMLRWRRSGTCRGYGRLGFGWPAGLHRHRSLRDFRGVIPLRLESAYRVTMGGIAAPVAIPPAFFAFRLQGGYFAHRHGSLRGDPTPARPWSARRGHGHLAAREATRKFSA